MKSLEDVHLAVLDGAGHRVTVECLPSEKLSISSYRAMQSPLFVQGLAKYDTYEVTNLERGEFRVLSHGGMLAVQIFGVRNDGALRTKVSKIAERLGGELDNWLETESPSGGVCAAVMSLPVSAGFSTIESALDEMCQSHSGMKWYYGNVYDPVDGITPLGWWNL